MASFSLSFSPDSILDSNTLFLLFAVCTAVHSTALSFRCLSGSLVLWSGSIISPNSTLFLYSFASILALLGDLSRSYLVDGLDASLPSCGRRGTAILLRSGNGGLPPLTPPPPLLPGPPRWEVILGSSSLRDALSKWPLVDAPLTWCIVDRLLGMSNRCGVYNLSCLILVISFFLCTHILFHASWFPPHIAHLLASVVQSLWWCSPEHFT